MTWRTLLQEKSETLVSPWIGGRALRSGSRYWRIEGPLPREHGWVSFSLEGRKAHYIEPVDAPPEKLLYKLVGYLVGDRLVSRDVRVDPDPKNIVNYSERVHLIEPGLDRFVLISAGRVSEDSPLIYIRQELPLGPEEEVQTSFLDGKNSVAEVRNVTPALDAAFRMEIWHRKEAEKRRRELEEQRRLEEEARQKEARRQEIVEKLGDGAGRRELAKEDFETAARAALAIGGAEYLDHRNAVHRNEIVVRFRFLRRRFECTCDHNTLRIIDSGICLTAHGDDEFADGTKGDSFFSLESLPSVIQEADREGKLVVYRHVD